jgi:hypothetical protein
VAIWWSWERGSITIFTNLDCEGEKQGKKANKKNRKKEERKERPRSERKFYRVYSVKTADRNIDSKSFLDKLAGK